MSWDMLLEPIVLLTVALGVMIYTSYTMFTMVDYYKMHRSKPLLFILIGAAFVYSVGQWTTGMAIEMTVSPHTYLFVDKESILLHGFVVSSAAIVTLIWKKKLRSRYMLSAGLFMLGIAVPLVHILYFDDSINHSSFYIHLIFIFLICGAGVIGAFYWFRQKLIPFYRLKAGIILAATVTASSFLVMLAIRQGRQVISFNYPNNIIQLLKLLVLFFVVTMFSMALQWWLSKKTILESYHKYKLLVEQFSDTTALIKDDRWEYINPSGLRLFQAYHERDLIGKSIYALIDPRDHERFSQWLSLAYIQQTEPIELRWKTFEGEQRHTEVTLLMCTEAGNAYQQIWIKDIMKQKKEEERRLSAAKLSATKHMAACIAHEIRNPLTSIKGFLHLIMNGRLSKKTYYTVMKQELLDIESIINNMLMLVKPQTTDYKLLDISKLVNEEIAGLEQLLTSTSVQIQCRMDTPPLLVRGVEQQLRIVFHNLLKNAAQATQEGGTVYIQLYLNSMDEIVIVIKDEGEGITEEQLARIGQAYFTTKEQGTGIELMVSYTIIDHHGGRISADSKKGFGTTYTIWLPKNKQATGAIGVLSAHAELIADKP